MDRSADVFLDRGAGGGGAEPPLDPRVGTFVSEGALRRAAGLTGRGGGGLRIARSDVLALEVGFGLALS